MISPWLTKTALLCSFIIFFPLVGIQGQNLPDASKEQLKTKVEVFPNPSPTQRFSVAIYSIRAEKVKIQILNAFMKVVFQKEMMSTEGFSLHRLNLNDRPKGWYYLVLTTSQQKIVKRLESM